MHKREAPGLFFGGPWDPAPAPRRTARQKGRQVVPEPTPHPGTPLLLAKRRALRAKRQWRTGTSFFFGGPSPAPEPGTHYAPKGSCTLGVVFSGAPPPSRNPAPTPKKARTARQKAVAVFFRGPRPRPGTRRLRPKRRALRAKRQWHAGRFCFGGPPTPGTRLLRTKNARTARQKKQLHAQDPRPAPRFPKQPPPAPANKARPHTKRDPLHAALRVCSTAGRGRAGPAQSDGSPAGEPLDARNFKSGPTGFNSCPGTASSAGVDLAG